MVVYSKLNPYNEKIKKQYFQYLKNERSLKVTEDTASSKMSKINRFDEICNYVSFTEFDSVKGANYYQRLETSFNQEEIEISTMLMHINTIKEFLMWYANNHKCPRQKILKSLNSLNIKEAHKHLANCKVLREYPTAEEFKKIIDFEMNTLEDKRDKILIVFLYISCARISAVLTSKISSVDLDKMIYLQNPTEGVHTKRNKYIVSKLFNFNSEYYDSLKEWVLLLQEKYGFNESSPLFPKIQDGMPVNSFVMHENDATKILKKRCNLAGVKPYVPHQLRHYGIFEALGYISSGRQLKALSQSVGHEFLLTILEQYANMQPDIYLDILTRMIPADKSYVSELSIYSTEILAKELYRRTSIEKSY